MKKRISPHKVWQYRKANYDQLREELHQYQQEFNKLDASTRTDDMWLVFKTKLTTLMKMYIPQKTVVKQKHKQWINREVKSALRRRNKLFKKKKASQKPSDIKKYKDAKATAQRIQRKAYWEYVDNIIEFGDPEKDENPGKQKRFWSYIKSLRKDTSGVSLLKENGKMHADPKDKADILNRQYESVFTKEDTSTTIPNQQAIPFHRCQISTSRGRSTQVTAENKP